MTYTDDEHLLLTMLPSEVGSAVIFSDKSGAIGTTKEMMASAKSAVSGAKAYPNNGLIQSVVPNFDDRPASQAHTKQIRDRQIARLTAAGVKTRDDMIEKAVTDARAVSVLLGAKADATEAAEYKAWVMSIGTAVANAAKEGGFLGIGGEMVSEDEEEILARIKAALD